MSLGPIKNTVNTQMIALGAENRINSRLSLRHTLLRGGKWSDGIAPEADIAALLTGRMRRRSCRYPIGCCSAIGLSPPSRTFHRVYENGLGPANIQIADGA